MKKKNGLEIAPTRDFTLKSAQSFGLQYWSRAQIGTDIILFTKLRISIQKKVKQVNMK